MASSANEVRERYFTEWSKALDDKDSQGTQWGDPGVFAEEDSSLWPDTMNRLIAILNSEEPGCRRASVTQAIDSLYANAADGLTSMGCGYFWGYVDAARK